VAWWNLGAQKPTGTFFCTDQQQYTSLRLMARYPVRYGIKGQGTDVSFRPDDCWCSDGNYTCGSVGVAARSICERRACVTFSFLYLWKQHVCSATSSLSPTTPRGPCEFVVGVSICSVLAYHSRSSYALIVRKM